MLLGPLATSTAVHDELYCRAMVLEDGSTRATVVCLDLIGLSWPLADRIEAAIRQRCDVETVFLNCSHTHSAPFTIPWSIMGLRAVQDNPEDVRWRENLGKQVAAAAGEAVEDLQEATLWAGTAPAQTGENRRLKTESGIEMAPNRSGPTDRIVRVLGVEDPAGNLRGVLFNHAAHPVVVHAASTEIGTDFVAGAVRRVREAARGQAAVMFAQGCAGNINADPLRGGHDASAAAGRRLGDAVLQALETAERVQGQHLYTASRTLQLPYRDLPTAEACAAVRAEMAEKLETIPADNSDLAEARWFARERLVCLEDLQDRVQRNDTPTLRTQAAILGVGEDWGLAAVSHEAFYELSQWALSRNWWRNAMVLGYTGGCESYLPTDEAMAEGGYEGASFPEPGAALFYPGRVALKPGALKQVLNAWERLVLTVKTRT
jgi:hypothetical protein